MSDPERPINPIIAPEPAMPVVLSSQDFLRILAMRTEVWLEEEREAGIVAEFRDEAVPDWNELITRHGISNFPVGADVERAVLLRSTTHDFAVALTRRIPIHAASATPTFEFGLERHGGETLDPTIDSVRRLLNPHPWSKGVSRFFVQPIRGGIGVDSPLNSSMFLPERLSAIPQARLRTEYGLHASLTMLQLQVQQASAF